MRLPRYAPSPTRPHRRPRSRFNPLRWILRPVAGQANTERGSRLARRANRDSATVRNCDLLNEIESEAIPRGARMRIVLSGKREGLEDSFQNVRRNTPIVVDLDLDRPKVSARHDPDRLTAAVLNCVSYEVRGQLCEAVTIPITSEVTECIEAQDAVRVVLSELFEYLPTQCIQIYRSRGDTQPDPEAGSGQVHEFTQDPIDALSVEDNPRRDSRRLVIDPYRRREHLREQGDGGERRAQVVSEDNERLIPELR